MSLEALFLGARSPEGSGVTLKFRFLRYSSSDIAAQLDVDFKQCAHDRGTRNGNLCLCWRIQGAKPNLTITRKYLQSLQTQVHNPHFSLQDDLLWLLPKATASTPGSGPSLERKPGH